jgi:hypothetical protein
MKSRNLSNQKKYLVYGISFAFYSRYLCAVFFDIPVQNRYFKIN